MDGEVQLMNWAAEYLIKQALRKSAGWNLQRGQQGWNLPPPVRWKSPTENMSGPKYNVNRGTNIIPQPGAEGRTMQHGRAVWQQPTPAGPPSSSGWGALARGLGWEAAYQGVSKAPQMAAGLAGSSALGTAALGVGVPLMMLGGGPAAMGLRVAAKDPSVGGWFDRLAPAQAQRRREIMDYRAQEAKAPVAPAAAQAHPALAGSRRV